jgi:hypothetical protein
MIPACEAFDVGVAVMALDDRLELTSIDGFKQFAEDASPENSWQVGGCGANG